MLSWLDRLIIQTASIFCLHAHLHLIIHMRLAGEGGLPDTFHSFVPEFGLLCLLPMIICLPQGVHPCLRDNSLLECFI